MVDLAIQKLNIKPGEVAFVGDRLDTDIVCARRAGITGICVLTGVTTEDKAVRARGELRPHYIYATLSDLCKEALAPGPSISSAPLEETVEPLAEVVVSQGAFTIPDEDIEGEEPEVSAPDDIDQLFEELNEEPANTSVETDNKFDFDTAMSVAEEAEPELPDSQKPATPAEEVEEADADADVNENTFDLDKALSATSTEEANPPTQNSETTATKERADAGNFDWKLD
jgi:hypothetical protein